MKISNFEQKYNMSTEQFLQKMREGALSKNQVLYHRGERRVRRVLRLFQSLLAFSDAFAFSVCSAVKYKRKCLNPR